MFVNQYSGIAVRKSLTPSGVTESEGFRRKTGQKMAVTFKNDE
jgi:hypothetical protein